MRHLFSFFIAFICLAVIQPSAEAAKPVKANKASKERLVLMPLRVPEEDKSLTGSMETALVQGMQQKYEVFSGEQVAQKAKAIFLKESKNTTKKDCDETRCMQDIAEAFQAELIASANVTKRPDGYFLALSIQNIFDNKVVYSNSVACKSCDAYQVVEKLKELSGGQTQATAPDLPAPIISGNKNDPEALLWNEAQKGNTIDDYQVYLDSYPKGKYIPFAKARIKKINDVVEAVAEQKQQQAWDAAQKENSEASYGSYLNAYPTGRFAGFAKIRYDKLKNDVSAKEEISLWKKVSSSNDISVIQEYLNTYPQGRYALLAQENIEKLKKEVSLMVNQAAVPVTAIQNCPECILKPFILASKGPGNIDSKIAAVKNALTVNGFKIVGNYSPYPDATILIVTSDELQKIAGESEFGAYGAGQRVSITKVNGEIQLSYTNPVYMANAYRMKNDLYDVAVKLERALGRIEEFGGDGMSASKARKYHYMFGMEYFDEPSVLAEYDSYEQAIAAVESGLATKTGGVSKVYRIDIPGKQETVFGVALSGAAARATESDQFIMSRIDVGVNKSTAHLPYEIVISGKRAYSLYARFRIPINFPGIKMSGANSFMAIMESPEAIRNALKKSITQ